ncbi:unnamed protein product [Rhodiola kirilowii]
MIRALSTSRSRRGGYDRLVDHQLQPTGNDDEDFSKAKLKRVNSVPSWKPNFGSLKDASQPPQAAAGTPTLPPNFPAKSVKKASKSHPIFGLFDLRSKKKATSKPEFGRYLEYLKEGGMWDAKSNQPVMYFK